MEAVIAAPVEEASGSSASITASEASAVTAAGGQGRVRVEARAVRGLDVPAFAVYSAPSLISLLAAHGAFGEAPHLVLSGINRGANVGRAILHSGTVGAALTGGVNGARGLAVSLVTGSGPLRWGTAASVVKRVLPLLAESPPGTVLNLNVPDAEAAEEVELVEARLAPFGIVHATMTERSEDHVHLVIADPSEDFGADTDAALLASGHATVTSVTSIIEEPERFTDIPVQAPSRRRTISAIHPGAKGEVRFGGVG